MKSEKFNNILFDDLHWLLDRIMFNDKPRHLSNMQKRIIESYFTDETTVLFQSPRQTGRTFAIAVLFYLVGNNNPQMTIITPTIALKKYIFKACDYISISCNDEDEKELMDKKLANIRTVSQFLTPCRIFDDVGSIMMKLCSERTNSFIESRFVNEKNEIPANANSVVLGAYPKACATSDSGYQYDIVTSSFMYGMENDKNNVKTICSLSDDEFDNMNILLKNIILSLPTTDNLKDYRAIPVKRFLVERRDIEC